MYIPETKGKRVKKERMDFQSRGKPNLAMVAKPIVLHFKKKQVVSAQ